MEENEAAQRAQGSGASVDAKGMEAVAGMAVDAL